MRLRIRKGKEVGGNGIVGTEATFLIRKVREPAKAPLGRMGPASSFTSSHSTIFPALTPSPASWEMWGTLLLNEPARNYKHVLWLCTTTLVLIYPLAVSSFSLPSSWGLTSAPAPRLVFSSHWTVCSRMHLLDRCTLQCSAFSYSFNSTCCQAI